jgi:hypothetical protein
MTTANTMSIGDIQQALNEFNNKDLAVYVSIAGVAYSISSIGLNPVLGQDVQIVIYCQPMAIS